MTINVSIIIPVYNIEEFLVKCLDSVVNQTLNNIEIIIINDGSTDNSIQVINDYQSRYSNIIVIDKNNEGPGAARNKGIEIARGKYIGFVDSDDYIEKNMMELLFNEAMEHDLDLVICNFNKVDTIDNVLSYNNHSSYNNKLFDTNDLIHEFLFNSYELIEGFSFNKLYKRSLFETFNIRYPENMKYEDIPTIFNFLINSKKCKYINKCLYHYVQHATSIVHSKNKENLYDFLKSIKMVENSLKKNNLISNFKNDYLIYAGIKLLNITIQFHDLIKNDKQLKQELNAILKKNVILQIIFQPNIPLKVKLKMILYKMKLINLTIKLLSNRKKITL